MGKARGLVFNLSVVTMVTETCYKCGCVFAMTEEFRDRRVNDHKGFFCPAGHEQFYTGKSEAERLREELQRKQELLDAEQARAARIRAERDAVSKAHQRMRARVFNGVCPCCNRTFQNLLRHMQTEHQGEFNVRNVRTAFGMTQYDLAQEAGITQAQVSKYERGENVAPHAATALQRWVERHTPKATEGVS